MKKIQEDASLARQFLEAGKIETKEERKAARKPLNELFDALNKKRRKRVAEMIIAAGLVNNA